MNQLAQCVPEGSGFPFMLILFIILVAGGIYLWRSGKLGPANEAIIKAQIAKAKGAVVEWERKLQAKAPATPAKDKTTRLAEVDALLAAGTISQTERDTARGVILND